MRTTIIRPVRMGTIRDFEFAGIATDKSISHRCAIFALLASAPCRVRGYLMGEDTLHTLEIARALGLGVESQGDSMIFTPPKDAICEPNKVLDCGNAGTGMRLFAGLLSGVNGHFVLTGDEYLNNRPMARIIQPLESIGASIRGRVNNTLAPLSIVGAKLRAFDYRSPISSAQVKSAMILAGLSAEGISHFSEPFMSRDHSENMLKAMGARILTKQREAGYEIEIGGMCGRLDPFSFNIPSDPSSAFFFAVAACVLQIKVRLKNVLLNETRIEAFKILEKMGAKVSYEVIESSYERIGHIEVCGAPLQAVKIDSQIAWLIDELPALSVCFAIANGVSEVRNARELRVKESDRIHASITNLRVMGIECEEFDDGFRVCGGELKQARVQSFGDHRIAMSFAIAQLVCGGAIEDSECIDVSFPRFLEFLSQITQVENIEEKK